MTERIKNLLFFFGVSIILLIIEIAPTGFVDPDGYYHAHMAQLLANRGIVGSFPWLPYTTLGKSFADLHFLYHVALVPFVNIDPIFGPQLFNVLAGTAFAFVFYRLLRLGNISYPKLWTLALLFGAPGVLFRLVIVKAVVISLFLIFLFLNFLSEQKYKSLGLISFIFVWTYTGFIFLPVILFFYCLAVLCQTVLDKTFSYQNLKEKFKFCLRPLLYTAGGIVLGVVLFPHSENFIRQIYSQVFQAGLEHNISVGDEWYSPSMLRVLEFYTVSLFIWIEACGFFLYQNIMDYPLKKSGTDLKITTFKRFGLTLFFLSLFFFGLSLKSNRFIEMAGPFMIAFSAYALQPLLAECPPREIKKIIRRGFMKNFLPGVLVWCVLITSIYTTALVFSKIHNPPPAQRMEGVTNYLLLHSKPDDIVFSPYWDNFPLLFFYNDKNFYINGLDPRFMYLANQNKYWLWEHISEDSPVTCATQICNQSNQISLDKTLSSNFNTSYIIISPEASPRLFSYLERDANFIKVYSDDKFSLFLSASLPSNSAIVYNEIE